MGRRRGPAKIKKTLAQNGARWGWTFAAALATLCCVGAGPTRPLPTLPGQHRDDVATRLQQLGYCGVDAVPGSGNGFNNVTDPDGRHAGLGIDVVFDGDNRVTEIWRYQELDNDDEAIARWGDLLAGYSQELGRSSQRARVVMRDLGITPRGALAWDSWFRAGQSVIAAVFRLDGLGTQGAHLIEVIAWSGIPGQTDKQARVE